MGAAAGGSGCARSRCVADVNTDQQNSGLGAFARRSIATRRRGWASRRAIDQALYDAFGQRRCRRSTRALNQYRVVHGGRAAATGRARTLERRATWPARRRAGAAVARSRASGRPPRRSPSIIRASFPRSTLSFNLAAGRLAGRCRRRRRSGRARASACRRPFTASFQGTARRSRHRSANQPWLIAAALLAVYIVLGMLYESYIHPLTILSTLPSAGAGALLALLP